MGALSAAAGKSASTTLWLPRLPRSQLSGTVRSMMVHLMMWSHKAITKLVGTVTSVAASGEQALMPGLAKLDVAAPALGAYSML